MPRLRIHYLVGPEIETARLWYEGLSPFAAERFVESFYSALVRVQRHPTAHAPWRPPYRRIRLVRFPYLIIYHTDRQQTSILLLAHQRFEPARTKAMIEGRLASLE